MKNQSQNSIYVIGHDSATTEQLRMLAGMSNTTIIPFADFDSALNAATGEPLPSLIVIASGTTDADNIHAAKVLNALEESPLGHIPTLLCASCSAMMPAGTDDAPNLFKLLLNTIPNTVLVHDTEGIITNVNTIGAETLAQPVSTIIGKSMFDILHIASRKDFNRALYKTRTAGIHTFSIPISISGDRYSDVTIVQSAITTSEETAYISIITGTPSQEGNEYLEKFTEQIRQICDEAGTTCHALNQPLQAILGNSDLLLMDMDSNDRYYEVLEEIREQSKKMAVLTKKLNQIIRQDMKSLIDDVSS